MKSRRQLARLNVLMLVALAVAAMDVVPVPVAAQGLHTVLYVDRHDDPNPSGLACDHAVDADCSLRAAILIANAQHPADAVSILLPRGEYLLTISGPDEDAGAIGDLDITHDLEILGQPGGWSYVEAMFPFGEPADRLLHVQAVTVEIVGVDLRGGHAANGGAVYNAGGDLRLDNATVS